MKTSMMFVIGIVATSLISCTRSAVEKNGSDVIIKIPSSQVLQSNSSSSSFIEKLLSKNSLQTLSSSSSSTGFSGTRPLNCFAVLVSGPIDALKRNHCYKKSTSAGAAVDFLSGGVSAIVGYGASIELNDLDTGADRVFRLVGFHSSNGQCGSLESNHNNYGNPYIVSEVGGVKLEPGTVSITMPMTFVDDKYFDRCDGPDFPDDHDDNSGGAKKLAIQKDYFPVNQIVENSCQSVDVVAQSDSGNYSSVTSAASFKLVLNGAVVVTYNSHEECTSGVNAGAVTLPALQGRKNVWFLAPSKGGSSVLSFDLSFSSNPDGLTVVPLANVAVRNSDEMSFDISAPQRVLTENCYPFSMEAKYMSGSIYSGFYSPANVSADNAILYSDASCTTVASTVGFMYGISSPVYFKTSSGTGAQIKIYADYSGWVTGTKVIEVGEGSSSVSQVEIQYNNQISVGDCTRARVTFLNEEHTAVPLTSAVTLNLSDAGTVAKFTDDQWCMTSNSGVHTVAAGQSTTDFYFEPLTYGNSSVSLSGGSLSSYAISYFAKHRYKLGIINQSSAQVDPGTCMRFDIHTQYQNSSSAYLSGTSVNVASPFPMYSDMNCTAAIGSTIFISSSQSYVPTYFLVDNPGAVLGTYSINASGASIQSGTVSFSVNPRPALQASWGLPTYKIPAEYPLDLKLIATPFTGVGPFTYTQSAGTGSLSGDIYTSSSGNTATFAINDSNSNTITASTQTVSRTVVHDFMTSMPGGYTFGRSSSGMYYDASGTLVSASTSTARFDHNPDPASGFAATGLLIEPARINHTVYSSNLNAGNWNKSFTNVTTSAAVTDPMGNTYSSVLEWASPSYTNMAYASSQAITPTAYTTYAGSVFVKKDTARFVGLKVHEDGGSYGYSGVVLDLDTGNVVGMYDPWNSGDVSINFGVQKLKNGWFRIWTNYVAKGGTGILLYLYPVYHGGTTLSPNRDNSVPGRTYFWGAQLEVGESVTSYIATGASTATRSADMLTGNLSNVASSFLSATETSLRLEYAIPEGGQQSDGTLLQICGSGCSGEQLMVTQAMNGMINLSELSSSGTQNQSFYSPAFSIKKGVNKLAVSLSSSASYGFNWGFNSAFNTSGNAYSSYHPNYSGGVLNLGNSNGGLGQATMHIRKLEGWTHSLSMPALRLMAQ